jgi:hypothetical protein
MYLALGGWSEVKEAARFLLKIKPAPEDAVVSEPQVGLCSIEVKFVDAQGQAVDDDYSLDFWRRRPPGEEPGSEGGVRNRTGQWYRCWEQRGGIQSIKRVSKREELYPGEYIITADHAWREVGEGWKRDPTPTGISDVIHVDGVENRDVIAVVRLEGDAPLTIRFVDSQTLEPVGQASHWLYRDDGRMLGNGGHADANGILRYRSLKAGTYRLESRGKGPGMAKSKEYVPLEEPVKVEVIKGQENEVTIRLDPNELKEAQIKKRWPWSVTGKVTDEQGRPMEGVRVQVAAGWGTLGRSDEDVTDADGRYTLRFIPGGLVMTETKGAWYAAIVSAFKDGYYEANLCSQGDLAMAYEPIDPNARGKRWRYQGVVLPNEPYEVDFVMVPSARIKGRLIDEEGRPIAGQGLSIGGEGLYPASSVLASTEMGADGRFVVDRVPRQICWFTYRYERRKEVTSVPIDFSEPVEYEVVLVYEATEYGGATLKVEKAEPKVSNRLEVKVEAEERGSVVSAAELGEMRARGEEILSRMREVNRYWLVGPAAAVKSYAYHFVVIGKKREKIEVSDPREVFRDFRQGIGYHSLVHRVVREGGNYTITEVAEDEEMIRLDFAFEDPIKIIARHEVAFGCNGCFMVFPKKVSLWLDAATMVPVEVQAEEVQERFSEYASAAEGCYVPLRIEIEHEDSYFDWRFRLHEPGLWLFGEGRFAEEGKEPAPAALVEKVRVNDASIIETKVPSFGTDRWPMVLSIEQGRSEQGAQQLILTTLTRKDVTVRAVAGPGRMVLETVGTLPVKDGKRPSIQLVAAPDVADLWSKKRKELREATVQLLAAGGRFVKPGHLSLRCVENAGQCEVRFLFMGPEDVERRIKVTVELRDANGVSLATMTRQCADGRIYARANREPDRSGSRREEMNLERFYFDPKLADRIEQVAVTFEGTPPLGSASHSTIGEGVEAALPNPDAGVEPLMDVNAVAWGQVVDGLQLGLSPDREDRVYRQGDVVNLSVYVRNAGETEQSLTYYAQADGDGSTPAGEHALRDKPRLTNDRGKAVTLRRPIRGADVVMDKKLLLGAGETQKLGIVRLAIKPVLTDQPVEYSAELEVGVYRVIQSVNLLTERMVELPTDILQLHTGELELTVLGDDVYVQYLRPSEGLRFGPEVLEVLSLANRQAWIDFDTGRTIDEPGGFGPDIKGMDAAVEQDQIDSRPSGLRGLGLKTIPVPNNRWNAPPGAVAEELSEAALAESFSSIPAEDLPATFFFETQQGGIGILQLIGLTANPQGMKIRYKLVEQSPAEKNAS